MRESVRSVAKTSGKGLLVVAPAIVAAYFSYKEAQVEAQVRVAEAQAAAQIKLAETTKKAEAGYDVLVAAVEDLRRRVDQIEGVRPPIVRRRVGSSGSSGVGSGAGSGSSSLSAPAVAPAAEEALPRSLDDAVKSEAAKN